MSKSKNHSLRVLIILINRTPIPQKKYSLNHSATTLNAAKTSTKCGSNASASTSTHSSPNKSGILKPTAGKHSKKSTHLQSLKASLPQQPPLPHLAITSNSPGPVNVSNSLSLQNSKATPFKSINSSNH